MCATVTYTFSNGTVANATEVNQNFTDIPTTKILDADSDTKVDAEENADEDIIRMDTAGNECFNMSSAGVLTLARNSAASAFSAASQDNITDQTWTQVVLGTEDYDIRGEFASNAFTATVAGKYLCIGSIYWQQTVADRMYFVGIYINDTIKFQSIAHSAAVLQGDPCVAGVADLGVGGTVKLYGYVNIGAATADMQAGIGTRLMVIKIT